MLITVEVKPPLTTCAVPVSLPRHPFGLLPGAAASQHSLVSDQRHVVGRGALPGLPIAPAGLCALSPLHEPRGRGAGLPHAPQTGRVWNLHDQHAGWAVLSEPAQQISSPFIILHSSSAALLLLLLCLLQGWNFSLLIVNDLPGECFAWRCISIDLSKQIWLLSQLANANMIQVLKWILIRPCCLYKPIKNDVKYFSIIHLTNRLAILNIRWHNAWCLYIRSACKLNAAFDDAAALAYLRIYLIQQH